MIRIFVLLAMSLFVSVTSLASAEEAIDTVNSSLAQTDDDSLFTEDDYKQSSEYIEGRTIRKNDYEKFNQRFLIHIVPVIGNIKMND